MANLGKNGGKRTDLQMHRPSAGVTESTSPLHWLRSGVDCVVGPPSTIATATHRTQPILF